MKFLHLGKLPKQRAVDGGMRNAFHVRRNHIQVRMVLHEALHIVLVHDKRMPQRKLCSGRIDRDDFGFKASPDICIIL